MLDSVRSRLIDALTAAELIQEWSQQYNFDQMSNDILIESAFMLQLQRIGEALRIARDKSEILEQQFSSMHKWIGLRNRLVHDYREIDLDLLWITVENDIPTLIATLNALIDE